ncbi:MAG: hypothetical protein HYU51_14790 [Candidatus Rokubacteria bacterium]|nr:hypothetical protein [Candidatus Rokubacteria bacterium]
MAAPISVRRVLKIPASEWDDAESRARIEEQLRREGYKLVAFRSIDPDAYEVTALRREGVGTGRGASVMDRLVFVVHQDRKDLYERFRVLLDSEPGVEVVLERRLRQRRQRDGAHAHERRRWDRRVRPLVDTEVAARGWTVVRVSD